MVCKGIFIVCLVGFLVFESVIGNVVRRSSNRCKNLKANFNKQIKSNGNNKCQCGNLKKVSFHDNWNGIQNDVLTACGNSCPDGHQYLDCNDRSVDVDDKSNFCRSVSDYKANNRGCDLKFHTCGCATTPPPTTTKPTTAAITTKPPTTQQPTTQQPTTQKPTTQQPTTQQPTTQQPTTQQPTTQQPTTQQPTTQQPTTQQPTTQQPTTPEPTTQQPTTPEPTTQQPTTAEPTTQQPTTPEPTTQQPTTSEPTTQQPTTAEPTTQPPPTTLFQPTFVPGIVTTTFIPWWHTNGANAGGAV